MLAVQTHKGSTNRLTTSYMVMNGWRDGFEGKFDKVFCANLLAAKREAKRRLTEWQDERSMGNFDQNIQGDYVVIAKVRGYHAKNGKFVDLNVLSVETFNEKELHLL